MQKYLNVSTGFLKRNFYSYYCSTQAVVSFESFEKNIFNGLCVCVRYKENRFCLSFFTEALLQSRPLPHIPALPEGDPPSGSSVQSISQQTNVQQHSNISASGLLEAANRSALFKILSSIHHSYIIANICYYDYI